MHRYDHRLFVTELPEGFTSRHQWPEFAEQYQWPPFFHATPVGAYPRGMRRGLWPIILEEYVSDDEPPLGYVDETAPNRVILWQRLTRTDIPRGWSAPSRHPAMLEGFAEIVPGEDYTARWSKIARQERKACAEAFERGLFAIEQLDWETFERVYRASTTIEKAGLGALAILKRKWFANSTHIMLWGARNLRTGEVVAAVGVVNSPSHQASYYAAGCKRAHLEYPLVVGLLAHWYEVSQAAGIRFLHFGVFWIPGKPKSWQGFSTFKMKLRPKLVLYPPTLVRFKRGTLW